MVEDTPSNEAITIAIVLICLASFMFWVIRASFKSGKFYIHFFTFFREKHPVVFRVVIYIQSFLLIAVFFFAVKFALRGFLG